MIESPSAIRIRVIRAILGDKPGEFARRLGVSVQTLTRWEDGIFTPGLANELAIAKLCNEHSVECFCIRRGT